MKKVLAVFLTLVMLFSVCAFSTSAENTDPAVTVVTNQGSPVKAGTTTYFTVRFDNFSKIKGIDVTVSVTDAASLNLFSATGFSEDLVENSNYKSLSDKSIKFVDLLASGITKAQIVFKVEAPTETASISVSGDYADSGISLFDVSSTPGVLEVTATLAEYKATEDTSNTDTTFTLPSSVTDTKFVPYGSMYRKNQDGTVAGFATKNENGTFTIEEGTKLSDYVYNTFDQPADGITTYGVSQAIENPAVLRFGSYSEYNDGATTHGTMLFEGDWLALKHYYIKQGISVQQFVEILYNKVYTTLSNPANAGKTHVFYNVPTGNGNEKTRVNVYLFNQNKYLWKDNGTNLEYAIRLFGATKDTLYTGVAYSVKGDVVKVSPNVKTFKALETHTK